jgi:hypothetical protein
LIGQQLEWQIGIKGWIKEDFFRKKLLYSLIQLKTVKDDF